MEKGYLGCTVQQTHLAWDVICLTEWPIHEVLQPFIPLGIACGDAQTVPTQCVFTAIPSSRYRLWRYAMLGRLNAEGADAIEMVH